MLLKRIVVALLLLSATQVGCTVAFLSDEILNAIGPTTAVAVASTSGTANAGQGFVLNGGSSFLQFGSGSTPSATAAGFTYLWELTATPAGAVQPTLANTTSSQLTFTGTTLGTYTVRLTVTDGTNTGSSSASIEII